MFAKLKGSSGGATHSPVNGGIPSSSSPVLDMNPISKYFDTGTLIGTSGPELTWRMIQAHSKADNKEGTLFFFDKRLWEKLHKGRRKEIIVDALKHGFKLLHKYQHPKLLQIIYPLAETGDSLAFGSEPIFGSLANIFGYLQDRLRQDIPSSLREYSFLEFEVKYGLLQLSEALLYLHYSAHLIHRNICPQSVIINKRGTWKLTGFEFSVKCCEKDFMESVACFPFTQKLPKVSQPDLDYSAPETQMSSVCSPQSDMFSFGLLICSLYNNGRSPLESNLSTTQYAKHLEKLSGTLSEILNRIPNSEDLKEPLYGLLDMDPKKRPNSQRISTIKYFSDAGVNALQYLDTIGTKDITYKANFFNSLRTVLPTIPKKVWFQHILPTISDELGDTDVLTAALQPILYITEESTSDEYHDIILPYIKEIFSMPKSLQATVMLFDNILVFARKTSKDDLENQILPSLFSYFDSTSSQIQCAAIRGVWQIYELQEDPSLCQSFITRAREVLENYGELSVQEIIVESLEKMLDNVDSQQILEDVLPLLSNCNLQEPQIVMPVARIYKLLISDKKYGLTPNILATKVMPSIVPAAASPNIDFDDFTFIGELLQEILDQITKNQRNRINTEKVVNSRFEIKRNSIPIEINFNQPTNPLYPQRPPTLRLEMRRQSISADDISVKTPKTSGSSAESSPDATTNLLCVQPNLNLRRHSDNAISVPTIQIAPSSPTVGDAKSISRATSSTNLTAQLERTARRHSSINLEDIQNFQRRRHSSINPHDIKRVANKISLVTEDFIHSASNSIPSRSQLGLDFGSSKSPTRSRRSSVAAIVGNALPNPSGKMFGPSPTKTSSKILNSLGRRKSKTPTTSEKFFSQIGVTFGK